MDLLDRYLAAIRRNLPANKADDIVAELRDVISSRIEDREEALGRTLAKDEVSALLTEFGHPLVVASNYKPHQYLIGPEIFPFYLFTMKIVLAVVLAILVAMGAASLLFGDHGIVKTLIQASGNMWDAALANVAVVTLIFAGLERTGWLREHLRKWRPEQLPVLSDKPQNGWESAAEIGLGIAFILWWTGQFSLPVVSHNKGGLVIEAAPVWAHYYLPILALAVSQLVLNLIKWLRPRWRVLRMGLGAINTVAGLVILAGIYRNGPWVIGRATTMDPAEAARIADSVNLSLSIGLVAVGIIMVLTGLAELWKLSRRDR